MYIGNRAYLVESRQDEHQRSIKMCSPYQDFIFTRVIFLRTGPKGTDKVSTSIRLIRSAFLNRVRSNEVLLYHDTLNLYSV